MARIRNIKPEFWADPELTQCSRDARLLYIAMWNFADEHKRISLNPRYLRGECFPLDDDVTDSMVAEWIEELSVQGNVLPYEVGGKRYGVIQSLDKHNRLQPERMKSKIPDPPSHSPDQDVCTCLDKNEKSCPHVKRKAQSTKHSPEGGGPGGGTPQAGPQPTPPVAGNSEPGPPVLPMGADIERLCALLAELVALNAERPPARVDHRWRVAMGQMLVMDRRSPEAVETAIRFAQVPGGFWASKTLTPVDLRKHFDRVLLDAKRSGSSRASPVAAPVQLGGALDSYLATKDDPLKELSL